MGTENPRPTKIRRPSLFESLKTCVCFAMAVSVIQVLTFWLPQLLYYDFNVLVWSLLMQVLQ